MAVATFLQSDYNTQSGTAYPLALDGDIAVLAAVAAQFAPHAAATPDMTVLVDAGLVFNGTSLATVAQQTSAAIAAPAAGLLRIDRIVLDRATGTASVVTGTAVSSAPLVPAIPAGKLPCAQVALTSSTTAITDSLISNERDLRQLGLGTGAYATVGTAAAKDAGTGAGQVLLLDGTGAIPASVSGVALPLGALPFPTVDTADNTIGATAAAVAGSGGTVSIPVGVNLTLGEQTATGFGRLRSWTTTAWTSPALDASSTYYLRAQIAGGVFTPYVQKGSDSDTIPTGLLGTPGGASGGGFDSTVIDILLARVVTGAAGAAPAAFTNFVNAAELRASWVYNFTATRATNSGLSYWCGQSPAPLTLNWARRPINYPAGGFWRFGYAGAMQYPPEDPATIFVGSTSDGTGTFTAVLSRYAFNPVCQIDTNAYPASFTFSIYGSFYLTA